MKNSWMDRAIKRNWLSLLLLRRTTLAMMKTPWVTPPAMKLVKKFQKFHVADPGWMPICNEGIRWNVDHMKSCSS